MSSLIRYFLAKGFRVAGYDRTPSKLTKHLCDEGAEIHYTDDAEQIPEAFRMPEKTISLKWSTLKRVQEPKLANGEYTVNAKVIQPDGECL